MTNTQTVTDAQIAALRDEAAVAGDTDQVAICNRALGLTDEGLDPGDLSYAVATGEHVSEAAAWADGMHSARAECARVIARAADEASS